MGVISIIKLRRMSTSAKHQSNNNDYSPSNINSIPNSPKSKSQRIIAFFIRIGQKMRKNSNKNANGYSPKDKPPIHSKGIISRQQPYANKTLKIPG